MSNVQVLANFKKSFDINTKLTGILNTLPKTSSILSAQNLLSETSLEKINYREDNIIEKFIRLRNTSGNVAKVNKEILKVTIEDGKKNEIYKGLQTLDAVEMVDILSQSSNTFEMHSKPGASSRRAVFDLCVEKGWILTELTPTETKLEDVFRELTMN